jgi:tripartite-type tricarboxylate transporter receptor subunit TctC
MKTSLSFVAVLSVAATLAITPQIARADDYPNRPITLIVPFPPGGSTTVMARNVADKMSVALGQSIIVDNRGGAGGTIGTRLAAKAAPDGYTILLSYTGTFSIAPTAYASVGYDPRKDFAPIGMIGAAPNLVVVTTSLPVKSIEDLKAYAKAQTAPMQYGSPGVGTVNHLAGELLANAMGVTMQHIPYKGNGPALGDLIGGHIPLMFVPIPVSLGNVQSGKLRALAISSAKRSPLTPDIPTLAESGLPGFDVALRYGLAAPAGTPKPIIDKLNAAVNAVVKRPDVVKLWTQQGAVPMSMTPEEFDKFLRGDIVKWAEVVKKFDKPPQ